MTTHQSLLERVRDPGNSPAWEEFDRIYRPMLHRYAILRGLDQERAAEVAQDVLTKLLMKMPTFTYDPAKGRFRDYLHRTVRNRIIDLHRRKETEDRHAQAWAGGQGRPGQAQDDKPTWEALYQSSVLDAAYEMIRPRFQEPTWACFDLHIRRRIKAQAVADRLGTTPNAVYINASRVKKAVVAFCNRYDEELGNGAEASAGEPKEASFNDME